MTLSQLLSQDFKVTTFLSMRKPRTGENIKVNNNEKEYTRAAVFSLTILMVNVKNIPAAMVSLNIRKKVAIRKKIRICLEE